MLTGSVSQLDGAGDTSLNHKTPCRDFKNLDVLEQEVLHARHGKVSLGFKLRACLISIYISGGMNICLRMKLVVPGCAKFW